MEDIFIPVCILGLYLPMLALARITPIRSSPQRLKQLHLGGWLASLLLFGGFMCWRVSLTGQWLDVLPFGLAWVAAGSYFLLRRKELKWPSKIYFGFWFSYPLVMAVAFLADRILFVIVSVPLVAFLPHNVYFKSQYCVIQDGARGLIAPRILELLTPIGFVLERHEGVTQNFDFAPDSIVTATVLPASKPGEAIVKIITNRGPERVIFER